jgi:NADH:ubiquinone oxidoreductase subunit 5 (subunit L)/multisubunit Na+/H+ antiporter MnhA subunit/multisubunit Na+/H+ antiporter MnhB subunit
MEIAFIVLPFVLAGAVPLLATSISAKWISRVIAGSLVFLFIQMCTLLPTLHEQGTIILSYPWVEQFNLALELYIDGLSAIFTLLITGIGAAVFLYAGYYMESDERAPRFLALLSAFTGSMLGVVLSGNLLVLFICWELTSVFSYMLIGFDGKNPDARSAATQALIVTGGGGLALLVGLVLLGLASGSSSFFHVLNYPMQDHPWYAGVTILILLGCFTKSAQFPFHFWLPGGMTAPTPASAFLHSATMVKAGVYLLARLYPTLGDTNLWLVALTGIGLVTMLVGASIALRQRDLKGMLAYATVSWLGALVLMLGLPHHEGYVAALVGIIGHALYKSPLFMVAGAIDHAEGTRVIDKLGGLARKMPGALAITVVCGLSMAGVIPLLGFAAKEALLHSVTELHEPAAPLVLLGVCLAAALTVTVAAILIWDVFFKKPKHDPQASTAPVAVDHHDVHEHGHDDAHGHGHHNSPLMLLGPGIIAAASVVLALLIEPVIVPVLQLAVPHEIHVDLHLFPGFTPIFFLSLGLIAIGVVVFLARGWWLGLKIPSPSSGRKIYMGFIGGLNDAGDFVLKAQSGKLSQYLVIILGVIGVILILPASQYLSSTSVEFLPLTSTNFMEAALLFLTIVAVVASILFKGHLLAILALGVAGYAVGGIFLLAPGPDIAMVQILVETLAAVMVIIMLSRINERRRRRAAEAIWGGGKRVIRRDILVSVLVGVGVGAFALAAVVNRPSRESIVADYYLEATESEAGVKDVVGAIVTDFRGTDTLFEITVFSMAAGGVLTVLYISTTRTGAKEKPPAVPLTASLSQISTPLTQLAAKLLLPVSMLIAIAHLLYAGDAPGDGFTAGVVGGISVALWYQVFGYERTKLRQLRVEFLIGIGVALAAGNALLPLLMGESFLHHYSILDIPLPGDLHFNSSTVFEIAIFLTVFGSIVTMINAMTRPEGIEQL